MLPIYYLINVNICFKITATGVSFFIAKMQRLKDASFLPTTRVPGSPRRHALKHTSTAIFKSKQTATDDNLFSIFVALYISLIFVSVNSSANRCAATDIRPCVFVKARLNDAILVQNLCVLN